jgi:hypothetical protein
MSRRFLLVRALAILAALTAAPAMSHHSPVAFDLDVTDFAVTGEIEYVDMRNPHSIIELRVEEADGSTKQWHIEFSSVNLLLRRGWDFDRIKVGDTVTCIGNPSRNGDDKMYMWSIVLADGTEFGK